MHFTKWTNLFPSQFVHFINEPNDTKKDSFISSISNWRVTNAHHRTEQGDHLSLENLNFVIIIFLNEWSFRLIRPLFIVWNYKPFEQFVVCTESVFWTLNRLVTSQWSALYGEKSWNVFIKNLNFFSTEERKTWTSMWMTWGWVNYQQKFVCFFKVKYWTELSVS